MLITCPNCQSSYTVADTALGEKGRSVRCAKCKEVWHAHAACAGHGEPAVEEWQPSVDEWKPSTDEWQPTVDPPAADGSSRCHHQKPRPSQPATQRGRNPIHAHAGDPPHVEDAPPVAPDQPVEATSQKPGVSNYEEIRRRKAARLKAQKDRGFGITAGRIAAAFAGSSSRSSSRARTSCGCCRRRLRSMRGLDFTSMYVASTSPISRPSYETQDGTRVLVVEGGIRNISSAVQPVANMRYCDAQRRRRGSL